MTGIISGLSQAMIQATPYLNPANPTQERMLIEGAHRFVEAGERSLGQLARHIQDAEHKLQAMAGRAPSPADAQRVTDRLEMLRQLRDAISDSVERVRRALQRIDGGDPARDLSTHAADAPRDLPGDATDRVPDLIPAGMLYSATR